MKLHLSILTGVASVAAIMSNVFADTAVTDPVGYVTIQVRAPGTLSFVAPSLVNKTEFAGVVTSHGANTITVAGTPFTPNAFDTDVEPIVGVQYYVEITNGAGTEGLWTNITTNLTNNQITTEDDLSGSIVDGTTTIKIRKHVSIADVFGATNAAGLFGSDQVSTADEIKILDTQTKNVKSVFYYDDGSYEQWMDADFVEVPKLAIQPGQGLYIDRKGAGSLSFVNVGHVKTGPTMMTFDPGISIIGVPHAVGANFVLDQTNLANILPTPLGPQSGRVLGGDQIAVADVLKVAQLDGSLKECFYYDDGSYTAWMDADFVEIGTTEQLKEGTSFVFVRQASAGTFTWTSPLEVIAP